MGGVNIPFEKGLLGHSDADVLLHAIGDALLGAAALGDIGKHFPDTEELIRPFKPFGYVHDTEQFKELFVEDEFKQDYRILNKAVRDHGYNIPPLVNAYMGLSPTMKLFGTAINEEFGNVEETGILIAVDEILPEKRKRYIDSFLEEHPEYLK